MKYEAAIGLEVHVQLSTNSKMFCACSTKYGSSPNTQVCPVCLGYPGAMPVMNEEAVRLTVLMGLMIGSDVPEYSKFDRKSYFYPDMPKNYQISQFDKPLCDGGSVDVEIDGKPKTINVTRIHLEEDVGKSTHFRASSGVDFNRAGVPLMEIVSEPEMKSPEDAFAYLHAVKSLAQYAGVSECNLEQGSMRCDVNCSVNLAGATELGTKTEIKNMNTFKGVYNALKYEIDHQIDVIESGGEIKQETLRWDVDAGVTVSMRSKEDAHDYRYFPEPDLMPVRLSAEKVSAWKSELPEKPADRRTRFVTEYNLPDYDAGVLVAEKAVADYFEAVITHTQNYKAASNWIMTEMMFYLSDKGIGISEVLVTPEGLAKLINLLDSKKINMPMAKEIFAALFEKGGDPEKIVEERGLAQVSDTGAIDGYVQQAMDENPKSVSDYKSGKATAAKFLVGQVMRLSKGKANPQLVTEILENKLKD